MNIILFLVAPLVIGFVLAVLWAVITKCFNSIVIFVGAILTSIVLCLTFKTWLGIIGLIVAVIVFVILGIVLASIANKTYGPFDDEEDN